MASQTAAGRVQRDLKEVFHLTFESSPPIYVAVEDQITTITAMIIGPPSTPYHGSCLLFRLNAPQDYPNTPPHVKLLTCDNGRVRLNPNLYADGKVCLSILGTWRGETTETWRSTYSLNYVLQAIQCMVLTDEPYYNEPGFEKGASRCEPLSHVMGYTDKIFHESFRLGVCEPLESILEMPIVSPVVSLSVQGPVAAVASAPVFIPPPASALTATTGTSSASSGHPLEPMEQFASGASSPGQTPTHQTSSWPPDGQQALPPEATSSSPTVLQPFMIPQPPATVATTAYVTIPGHRHTLYSSFCMFRHVLKRHFATNFAEYVRRLREAKYAQLNGKDFPVCIFEGGPNAARGKFQFDALLSRIERIKAQLSDEENVWRRKGEELTFRRSYLSLMLSEEASTIQQELEKVSGGPVNPNNAFVWKVTLLQPSYDLFADSMYSLELVFSPDLKEPPRVRFLQEISHPNISTDGVPLYFLRENEVPQDKRYRPTAVIRQILELLSNEPNSSPTSWVNEEAAGDCFSRDPERVKRFRRMCRQLSERTLEG